jgi:SNF2 family DNA or RNA helicase
MALYINAEITNDGKRIILMASGEQFEIAEAAKRLSGLTPVCKQTKPAGGMELLLSWPACIQLMRLYGPAWAPGPRLRAWLTDELMRRGAVRGDQLSITLPTGLVARPYQVEGALMIAATGRTLIFDDPGTGKTITTILGLLERHRVECVLPVVVIAPASVVDPWVSAWQAWAPHWRAVAWRGGVAKRRALAGRAEVYVTSYDTARMDAPPHGKAPLMDLRPGAVVVDECHLIKTPDSMRGMAARRLARHAPAFVALSGTPITHHPGDLWPALEALAPAAFPSGERFRRRYCATDPSDYSERIIGLNPHTEPEFRETLIGQHRRVAKADVLAQLPPKVYTVRTVELPAAYRKAYDEMQRHMLANLPDGQELSAMHVLPQLTRLAQLASAACDVHTTEERDELTGETVERVHVTLKLPSWKCDALLEVLEERPGEQAVTFAPSRQLMVLAGELAAKAGYRVGYVIGGQTMRERTETIETFQAGGLDLLCVTTQAGGVGITLTAARTAVFLGRPWSLVDSLQAEDRLHRIGSERHESIEIIDVVAKDTIDTEVREVLRGKASALSELLQDRRIVEQLLGGK